MAENSVITCPACAKKFKGRADLLGKKIKCPFCAKPFVVPKGTAESVKAAAPAKGAPAAKAAPAKAAAKSPFDDEDDDPNPYGVAALDLAPRCPHCAKEMLSADAVVCVHCGYNTLTRIHGETKKIIETTGEEHLQHLTPGLIGAGMILFFILLAIFLCTVWPEMAAGDWLFEQADAESIRMWYAVIALFIIFFTGQYAYKRLILEAKPKEKVKD
jgi:hypothetical protein